MSVIFSRTINSTMSDYILGDDADELTPFPESSGPLTFSSTSADDSSAGSGCQEIFLEVIYEDDSDPDVPFKIISGFVPTAGAAQVVVATPAGQGVRRSGGQGVRRIRIMRTGAVGSADWPPLFHPTGTITASIDGTPCDRILPDRGASEVAKWSTGMVRTEEFQGGELRILKPGGGAGWTVDSGLWVRSFNTDGGWIRAGDVNAAEQETSSSVQLAQPSGLEKLSDVMFFIGTTGGGAVTINGSMGINFKDGVPE